MSNNNHNLQEKPSGKEINNAHMIITVMSDNLVLTKCKVPAIQLITESNKAFGKGLNLQSHRHQQGVCSLGPGRGCKNPQATI